MKKWVQLRRNVSNHHNFVVIHLKARNRRSADWGFANQAKWIFSRPFKMVAPQIGSRIEKGPFMARYLVVARNVGPFVSIAAWACEGKISKFRLSTAAARNYVIDWKSADLAHRRE